MRICFWHADKPRERVLAEAFVEGVVADGRDTAYMRPLIEDKEEVAQDADVACMVGVKSKKLFAAHWRAGFHTVYFDKGYTRHSVAGGVRGWEYWRMSVNQHHPTHYLHLLQHKRDRADALDLKLKPWRTKGKNIVIAGSSAKYHAFYDLPEPTQWAEKVIKKLSRHTDRKIVYRPKPSWKEAVEIEGSEFNEGGSITDVLEGAHCLVTHGSNAVFEALLNGIPTLVLGDAVTRDISSKQVEEIESLYLATEEERQQLLNNLAYCQFTLTEIADGTAWRYSRPHIYR